LELLYAGFNVETVEYIKTSASLFGMLGVRTRYMSLFVSEKRLFTVICGKFGNISVCMLHGVKIPRNDVPNILKMLETAR
jgi:hypothetical protein